MLRCLPPSVFSRGPALFGHGGVSGLGRRIPISGLIASCLARVGRNLASAKHAAKFDQAARVKSLCQPPNSERVQAGRLPSPSPPQVKAVMARVDTEMRRKGRESTQNVLNQLIATKRRLEEL